MSTLSIARHYARAFHEVAHQNGTVAAVGRDLTQVADLLEAQPELRHAFESLAGGRAAKITLVQGLIAATTGMSREVERLLVLLAEQDQLALTSAIAVAFAERAGHRVAADVQSALPLSDDQRASLEQALARVTGRTVSISYQVDPSLVGGVVARVGSLIFDGSVVSQVERMRRELLADA